MRTQQPEWCYVAGVWMSLCLHATNKLVQVVNVLTTCRIPDDCIESKRYALFMARAVLKERIEFLQTTTEAKPCS